MNADFKGLATGLTAMLAAGAGVSAQTVSATLPQASAGESGRLTWTVGAQALNLDVPAAGRVHLEVYHPRAGGDLGAAPTFTLQNAAGETVLTRTVQPGAQGAGAQAPAAQDWATLIDQTLPAGQYRLALAPGAGPLAVRLAGVQATGGEHLGVTVHTQTWTPAVSVTTGGAGYRLQLLGVPAEGLEARVRDAQGHVSPAPLHAEGGALFLALPAGAGTYTAELRQAPGNLQLSQVVGFRVVRAAPDTAPAAEASGVLELGAQLILPGQVRPTALNLSVGAQPVRVDGRYEGRVAAGAQALTLPQIPGADVSVTPAAVTVPAGGVVAAQIQVRPRVALSVVADKPQVCTGDTVSFTARATTAYAGELPLDLTLLAEHLETQGLTGVKGTLSAERPGELVLTGTPTRPGPLNVTARLAPWDLTESAQVYVLASATSLQLTRAPLPEAQVGETVTVTLQVTNTAAEAVSFALEDQLPAALEALEPTTFSGTLQPGETRALTYRARVAGAGAADLRATLTTPSCAAPQFVTGTLLAQEAEPAADLAAERSSVVSLPFDAPTATELVIAHRAPEGAAYVPGSSTLDGQAVSDPRVGPGGTLYWVVPGGASKAGTRGAVTYTLSHTGPLGALDAPALLARLRGERTELLQGQIDLQDLAAAQVARPAPEATENAGQIKLPLSGAQIRVRDRISVTVEAPATTHPTLTVNGAPVDEASIGETTEDGIRGVRRLTFVGVPLQIGLNVLQYGDDKISVYRVGDTARVDVTPVALTADGSTPLRVGLRTLDASGNLTPQSTVTVRTNLEPRQVTADTRQSGYQVKLTDGEGVLELQPQSAPTVLKVDVLIGTEVRHYTFDVKPDDSRVGVGVISATVGLGGDFSVQNNVTWQARATYEGPLAGGKLYVAADKDGLPTDRNTLQRYSVTGDASTETVPLQGLDPVALTYDHPSFRVQYRQAPLPIDVLPVGENLTALTAYSKGSPRVSGFVAAVPRDRVTGERVVPEGTRLVRLAHGDVSPGSETLELVTLERGTGKELRRVPLVRNVDYQLDLRSGVVTLARALDRVDAELNEQVIVAAYRLDNGMANRELAYGAQAQYTGEHHSVGVAAVSLDGRVTFGARARYDDGTTRADGLLAYSGGAQFSADVGTRLGGGVLSARVRYQDEGYAGLAPFAVGLNASATYDARLGQNLRGVVDGEYHATPAGQGGTLTARAETKLGALSVGGGLRAGFGDTGGLSAVASAGYHADPFSVDVLHAQPLGGGAAPETTVTTKYKVNDQVSLGFTDKVTWGVGHAAALTLDSTVGNVNYAVAYDLPNAGGQGNRARFGVTTSLALSERLSAGLRGSAAYDVGSGQADLGAGADLHYKADTVTATAGTDVVYGAQGFGVVVRAGVTGQVTPQLSLTADALAEFGAGKNGQRAALGYAYRDRNFNSLGTVRYTYGTLSGGAPELSSNLSAEYRQPLWALRGYADTRTLLNDRSSFTAQAGLSGSVYVTERFGVGVWGHVITQPSTGSTELGYGLEASFRALPGTWVTAGYNPQGFSGIGTTYTRPGAYLRLDVTLDETLGGQE